MLDNTPEQTLGMRLYRTGDYKQLCFSLSFDCATDFIDQWIHNPIIHKKIGLTYQEPKVISQ